MNALLNKNNQGAKPVMSHAKVKPFVQAKLTVNEPGDIYEQEADAMANRVMRMSSNEAVKPVTGLIGNSLQRKCAQCEEEEKGRKPIMRKTEAGSSGMPVSSSFASSLNASKGGGSSLPQGTRSFMENAFSTDFSGVRIHTGSQAAVMSKGINAKAFTYGKDIYFDEGQFSPNIYSGKSLLAHELTHTIQQKENNSIVSRRIHVANPRSLIPNPSGTGLVQTNRETIEDYLNHLCLSGVVTITNSGRVNVPRSFCNDTPEDSTQPTLSQSNTPISCGCICDLVYSRNLISISINDSVYPNTSFSPDGLIRSVGSEIEVPSPNSGTSYGSVSATGQLMDNEPWLILGHELCGHAWLANRGESGLDENAPLEQGRQPQTVERENLIRDEHLIGRRGTFRQAHCGESFSHQSGTLPSQANSSFRWSSHYRDCENWRAQYNMLNRTSYTLSDNIPIKSGELLPPIPLGDFPLRVLPEGIELG